MDRRRFVTSLFAIGTASGAGCLGDGLPTGGSTTESTDETTRQTPSEWTRSAECDGTDVSVIKVEWTRSSLEDEFSPIVFSDLPEDERELLRPVLEEGGFETCDPSPAFRRFADRVYDHRKEQYDPSEDDSRLRVVHLAYEGQYYGLYVQQGDEVFSGS